MKHMGGVGCRCMGGGHDSKKNLYINKTNEPRKTSAFFFGLNVEVLKPTF